MLPGIGGCVGVSKVQLGPWLLRVDLNYVGID